MMLLINLVLQSFTHQPNKLRTDLLARADSKTVPGTNAVIHRFGRHEAVGTSFMPGFEHDLFIEKLADFPVSDGNIFRSGSSQDLRKHV